MLLALKHEVLGLLKVACKHRFGAAYTCMLPTHACVPKSSNFDNFDGPTSNGHNSLNIKYKLYKIYVQIEAQDVYIPMK